MLHAAQHRTAGNDRFCCSAAPSLRVAAESVRLCFHIHPQNCFYMHYLGFKLQHWLVASPLGQFENRRICFQSWKEAAEAPSLHWSSDSTAALSAASAFEVPVPHVGVQWVTLKGKSDETASRTCCYMWYLSGIYQNRKEIPDLGSGTELQKH